MGPVRRALPSAPGEWSLLAAAVRRGLGGAGDRLDRALAPAGRPPQRGVRHLEPRLVFVTVDPADVVALGWTVHRLAAPAPDLALVHVLLSHDPGPDVEILRTWGADGPVLTLPPPVALAAHRRIAARVYALWHAGRP